MYQTILSAPFPSLVVEIGDASNPVVAHQASFIVGGVPADTATDMTAVPPPPAGQPAEALVSKMI
jgi:hypothetical protein